MADREKTVEWEQGETHEKQTRGPPIQLNNLLVDNNNPADLLDTLNLGKRNAVTEYVRVTKESTDFAIQALEKYEWDLLEAIGRFFDEGSHEQDRINVDMLTPAIEPIRTSKRVNKRRFKANKPTLRHTILNRATLQNGMESPRNPRAVILDPIALEYAPPEIITTAPRMFTSPYPDKLWYTGFMRPWERFTEEVLDQWTNESCTKAFDEIPVTPEDVDEFASGFEDHAVQVAAIVMDMLLGTAEFKEQPCDTAECEMGDAEGEDIANEDCVWAPRYVIKFRNLGEQREARLIGHVEFLAGLPGALSQALRQRHTADWGSFRCVLGDVVQWMLMANLRYSFLVSSDEIMFLRIDIEEKKFRGKTVLVEPWLNYSKPLKITDVFNPNEKKITARMALLHMLWLVVQNGKAKWSVPEELGNCLNYAAFTKENEDWKLRVPSIPKACKVGKLTLKL